LSNGSTTAVLINLKDLFNHFKIFYESIVDGNIKLKKSIIPLSYYTPLHFRHFTGYITDNNNRSANALAERQKTKNRIFMFIVKQTNITDMEGQKR